MGKRNRFFIYSLLRVTEILGKLKASGVGA